MGARSDRQATLDVPAAPQSAGEARRFVQAQLDDWDLRVDDDGVVLMVSELVTNAGLHANSDARVRLVDQGDCLRIEVTDTSTTPVQLRSHQTGSETGRGLRIVDALAVDIFAVQEHFALHADDLVEFEQPVQTLEKG